MNSDGSEIESEGEEEREEEERLQAAEAYKNNGNEHFKNQRFQEAIEAYTMASSLDVSNPTYPGKILFLQGLNGLHSRCLKMVLN